MYGNRFANMWDSMPAESLRRTWAEGMAGVTAAQISAGLVACKRREWPPTLPEFLSLCCPPPNYEHEFIESAHGRWNDSKTRYWTAQSYGQSEVRNHSWGLAKRRWIEIWHEIDADDPLPEIPEHVRNPVLQLPAPARVRSAIQAECMAKINDMLAHHRPPSKDWAHRIMAGPASYPRISEEFAKIALASDTAHG